MWTTLPPDSDKPCRSVEATALAHALPNQHSAAPQGSPSSGKHGHYHGHGIYHGHGTFECGPSMPPLAHQRSVSQACRTVADELGASGWNVEAASDTASDLVASKGAKRYAIEIKIVGEGRPDRVIAALSQAILQAQRHAADRRMLPMAVVLVDNASAALVSKIETFHREYAPGVAIGLVSEQGGSRFIGDGFEPLNTLALRRASGRRDTRPRKTSDLFTDLNQWMIKVLLAPELPEGLLSAPRGTYHSNSELAQAADVSMMSASRFVQRMREDGLLEDDENGFRLVRRAELFRLWKSAALRSSPELRMSFVIPGSGLRPLQKTATRLGACIGLFSAADSLDLGHVSGVPSLLYVRRIAPPSKGGWPGLVTVKSGEQPQLILKQALAPESVFRGAVRVDGALVSDVLQIWLDASAHPSRGREQADSLKRTVLSNVLGDAE